MPANSNHLITAEEDEGRRVSSPGATTVGTNGRRSARNGLPIESPPSSMTDIRGRLIVCIANAWDYDPTSKHQIARVLARHNRIVWVNYRGTRRPELSEADILASFAALGRVFGGARRVDESIVQVTPLVVPGARSAILQRLHRWMVIAQIRRAIRAFRPDRSTPIQVWSFAPDVPFLVDAFGEECFLYYCVDEYREFEGFDRTLIARREDELLEKADVVVTTSAPLLESKRVRRRDALLVRHGVDFDHFASAWRDKHDPPLDLASIPRPVFGYFGLIHHWVDLEFLARVARLRPWYSFVLLGDCAVDTSAVRRLPNVHLLGRKPYETLPAYCAGFEAGMMLFTQSAMTRHINPIKMREYLAAGLPVVSTPLPEAEPYRGSIRIAGTAEAFAAACDEIVGADSTRRGASISRGVRHETWEDRVAALSRTVLDRIAGAQRTVTKRADEVLPPGLRSIPSVPVGGVS
jgi:glycosyltransferase involved in cell wall biosynthesis